MLPQSSEKMLLFFKATRFMITKMTTMFVFSGFCVYNIIHPPGLGKNLLVITVWSSKDFSAREPTTAFCSNRPVTLFIGLGNSKDPRSTVPFNTRWNPHCLNNATRPGPAAHQPTHRSAFGCLPLDWETCRVSQSDLSKVWLSLHLL